MPYTVPPLTYDYAALEPHIDEQTMRIHHDKHHQAYVDRVNGALEGTQWADTPIEDVIRDLQQIPEDKRGVVRNHGGGHLNHTLFWKFMSPQGGGAPSGDLASAIDAKFGSFDAVQGRLQGRRHQPVRLRLGLARQGRRTASPSSRRPIRTTPSRPARRRYSASTSGSTPTTSTTRTAAPTTSTRSGTSSTGTASRSASRPDADEPLVRPAGVAPAGLTIEVSLRRRER